MEKSEVEGGVQRPSFIGKDPGTPSGWLPGAEEAEEVRGTRFFSRLMVETAGVRRLPCRDPAGRERMEQMAEAFRVGPTREWVDPGGTEEILQAGQAWGEVGAEAFYFWQIIWMDPRTMQF